MSKSNINYMGFDLPINLENEATILSSAFHNTKNLENMCKKINHFDFRYSEYQCIAWSLSEIYNNKLTVEIDTIILYSTRSPIKVSIDYNFVNTLITNYKPIAEENFNSHLEILKIDSIKSTITKAMYSDIYGELLNPKSDLSTVKSKLDRLNDILEKGYSVSNSQFKSMSEIIPEYRESFEKEHAFRTTGFRQLDAKLNEGLREGAISIVCGLPGSGKSSFTLSMMKNLINKGIYTAQFALEMNNMSLTTKLLAFYSRMAVTRLTKDFKNLNPKEKMLWEHQLNLLEKNKYLYLNDKPGQTLSGIREQIMILQDRLQTDYIVTPIDLFGKIKDFASSDNFARDYETKLNELQSMCRELNNHFILVAQINRSATTGKFKRPAMHHLKNAGAFEEVADLIFAVHRPYYNPEIALQAQIQKSEFSDDIFDDVEEDPNANLAEIILLKQRMGAGNVITEFYFNPKTTCLSPIDDTNNMYNLQKELASNELSDNDAYGSFI